MVLYQHTGDLIEARTKYLAAWENTCGAAAGQTVMFVLGSVALVQK